MATPKNPNATHPTQRVPVTRVAKAAALIGAGALGATMVTGVAFADASVSDVVTSADRSGGAERAAGRHGFGPMLLHGDGVVKTPQGTTANVRSVSGDVTAVGPDSLTLKAPDGFTQQFAVNGDTTIHRNGAEATIGDLKVGDKARASGTVTGATVTAKRIGALTPEEATKKQADRKRMMQERLQKSSTGQSQFIS